MAVKAWVMFFGEFRAGRSSAMIPADSRCSCKLLHFVVVLFGLFCILFWWNIDAKVYV